MFLAFIVDDDKYAVEATYMMFNWEELNISKVEKIYSPNNLTEKILSETPDVVFIDVEMGSVSGLDIIRECKEKGSDAHFIIISGHDNFTYAHTAVNIGAIHYLLKPIDYQDADTVTEKLKKLLKKEIPVSEHTEITQTGTDDAWLTIQSYIENNYSKKLTAQKICRETLINHTRFYELFKLNTGKTFIEYLTGLRLGKAKTLLQISSKSIEEIATEVGCHDVYYFNKIFKNNFGMSPKSYRAQNRRSE